MTTKRKRYKLSIDEAVIVAREILMRGQDVEIRVTKAGAIVYEVNKKAHRLPALHETGG